MKKLLLIVLFTFALFSLSGCGDENSGNLPEVEKGYTVTVQNKEESTSFDVEKNSIFEYSILESQTTNEYFLYWYYIDNNNEVKVENDITITKNITIIGKYSEHYTVTIKYDMEELTLNFLSNEILKFEDFPTSSNESFKYWYYVEDGNEVEITTDITITKDLIIMAKYEGSTGTLPWV
ncbi:MAG: hypothetical protein R3Y05_00645 [bacterium]